MKGEIIKNILKFLENGIQDHSDLVDAIINSGYGASIGKIEAKIKKKQDKRMKEEIISQKREKLHKYLYKLKKDGLIAKNVSDYFSLTPAGRKKLESIEIRSFRKEGYKKEVGSQVIIISYDIPIAFNKERNILRDILRMLGFEIVHKSVWVGKVNLPERFVKDLSQMRILDYVEIMEVTKRGSLKSLT